MAEEKTKKLAVVSELDDATRAELASGARTTYRVQVTRTTRTVGWHSEWQTDLQNYSYRRGLKDDSQEVLDATLESLDVRDLARVLFGAP